MRVLLINPKFPYSYWSYTRVCEMVGCKTLFPPLGLITVAALLPDTWEIRLVDLNAEPARRSRLAVGGLGHVDGHVYSA